MRGRLTYADATSQNVITNSPVPWRTRKIFEDETRRIEERMIGLIAVAFALTLATSVQAMSPVPLHQRCGELANALANVLPTSPERQLLNYRLHLSSWGCILSSSHVSAPRPAVHRCRSPRASG